MSLATTAFHSMIRGGVHAANRRVLVRYFKKLLVRNGVCSKELADTKGATLALEAILPTVLFGGSKLLPGGGGSMESVKEFISAQSGELLKGMAEREAVEFAGRVLPALLENVAVFVLGPAEASKALESGEDIDLD